MKKKLPIIIVVIIIGCGGAFYGGMRYAQSKTPTGPTQRDFQNFQQMGNSTRTGNGQSRTGVTDGEITAKDDKSITVKLRDGSSKIIFYSDSTEVSKFVSGTSNDLEIGKTVMVNGKTNQDGSISAQLIQMRPNTNTLN